MGRKGKNPAHAANKSGKQRFVPTRMNVGNAVLSVRVRRPRNPWSFPRGSRRVCRGARRPHSTGKVEYRAERLRASGAMSTDLAKGKFGADSRRVSPARCRVPGTRAQHIVRPSRYFHLARSRLGAPGRVSGGRPLHFARRATGEKETSENSHCGTVDSGKDWVD